MRISDWSSDVCSSDLEDHRADLDGAGAEGRPQGRRMNPLVEALQAQEAQAADQRKRGAGNHEERGQNRDPDGNVVAFHHSLTSPRIRNLASAPVATKPSTAKIGGAACRDRVCQ